MEHTLTNITSGRSTYFSPAIIQLTGLVADVGGKFVGIQESLLTEQPCLLTFINLDTENYLAVPFNPINFDIREISKVLRERIDRDNELASDRHISVKIVDLRRIAKQLLETSQQLDALIERKKS